MTGKNDGFMVFSGTANLPLAEKVAEYLGQDLNKIDIRHFPDGETFCQVIEGVRGKDVFVIQSCYQRMKLPVNISDSLLYAELFGIHGNIQNTHVDAVHPDLVRIDLLVPEGTFPGTRMILHLTVHLIKSLLDILVVAEV